MAGAKIAFLTPTISRAGGGLLDCVRRLGQELESLGHRVDVFSPEDEFSNDDLPQWAPLKVHLFPRHGPHTFAYGKRLAAAVADVEPNIIHTFGLWTHLSVVADFWHRKTGRPTILSAQGMLNQWALKKSSWKKRIAGLLYERRHLQRAHCLHAVSEREAAEMRRYGLSSPICIIPNGVDVPAPDGEATSQLAPWLGVVPDGKKILLFLGRIHPKKGLVPLLDGLSALALSAQGADIEEWHFVIAGWDQDEHLKGLQRKVEATSLSDRVSFIGPLYGNQKAAAYSHADAFILPSYGEGQPVAVLEAWSYGLPVLMTPECNLQEGFDAEAAITIRSTTSEISEGLRKLFSLSERERKEMGRKGQQLAEQSFSWRTIAHKMSGVYEWILGSGPKPAEVIN